MQSKFYRNCCILHYQLPIWNTMKEVYKEKDKKKNTFDPQNSTNEKSTTSNKHLYVCKIYIYIFDHISDIVFFPCFLSHFVIAVQIVGFISSFRFHFAFVCQTEFRFCWQWWTTANTANDNNIKHASKRQCMLWIDSVYLSHGTNHIGNGKWETTVSKTHRRHANRSMVSEAMWCVWVSQCQHMLSLCLCRAYSRHCLCCFFLLIF